MDFCLGDHWPVMVFLWDHQQNFLLASSACGRMPRHLQVEAGFSHEDEMMSEMGGTFSGGGSAKRSVEEELDATRSARAKMENTMQTLCDCIKDKSQAVTSPTGDVRKVEDLSSVMTNRDVLDAMSPESRDACVNRIKKERKATLQRFIVKEKQSEEDWNCAMCVLPC